ncbi:MAG: hypothetical protein LBU65_12590 [Planctomycetaceae bacterium]|nr:hypothetical protein [Planctomycetaceae bacterium]
MLFVIYCHRLLPTETVSMSFYTAFSRRRNIHKRLKHYNAASPPTIVNRLTVCTTRLPSH